MRILGGISPKITLLLTLASGCGGAVDSHVALRAASHGIDNIALKSAVDKGVDPDVLIRAADTGTEHAERIVGVCSSGLDLADPGDRFLYLNCLDLPGHQSAEWCDEGSGFSACTGAFKRAMKVERFGRIEQAERLKIIRENSAR